MDVLSLPVSSLYIGLHGLFAVFLANFVLYVRLRSNKVPEWQPDAVLRVQANFVENVPLALLLLFLARDAVEELPVARLLLVGGLELLRPDQSGVLVGQADSAATVLVDQADDALVDLATEHHFDHIHRLAVGYPHAFDEVTFDVQALEQVADLRPAAVHRRLGVRRLAATDDSISAKSSSISRSAREGVRRR